MRYSPRSGSQRRWPIAACLAHPPPSHTPLSYAPHPLGREDLFRAYVAELAKAEERERQLEAKQREAERRAESERRAADQRRRTVR